MSWLPSTQVMSIVFVSTSIFIDWFGNGGIDAAIKTSALLICGIVLGCTHEIIKAIRKS